MRAKRYTKRGSLHLDDGSYIITSSMPRTLPWAVGTAAKADPPKESRVRKRVQARVEPSSESDDLDEGVSTPKRKIGDGHCTCHL